MKPLHEVKPEHRWIVFNYGDTIPETCHILKSFTNGAGFACNGYTAYTSEKEMMTAYIPARPQDQQCQECIRKAR